MATVILGGGIIGLSTAYYLTQSPDYDPSSSPIYIIEATSQPFQSASGFAGGFLAKDWFSPAVAELGALSFDLHRELAEKHEGRNRWGYAPSQALSLAIEDDVVATKGKKVRGEDWLLEGTSRQNAAGKLDRNNQTDPDGPLHANGSPRWLHLHPGTRQTLSPISTPDSCAQVEPFLLCTFLLSQCQAKGVKLLLSTRATELIFEESQSKIQALTVHVQQGGEKKALTLQCSNILIAAGAWTPRVFSTLFPKSSVRVPIESLAGYSVVVRPNHPTIVQERGDAGCTVHALFCAPDRYWPFAPEAFSRRGQDGREEVYVAGLNSDARVLPLPDNIEDRALDGSKMVQLKEATAQLLGLSSDQDGLEVVRESLCFRPVTIGRGGKPILCRVDERMLGGEGRAVGTETGTGTGREGVFIAAGHGPWGISLSLGTGKVMNEMIRGVRTTADVSGLGLR